MSPIFSPEGNDRLQKWVVAWGWIFFAAQATMLAILFIMKVNFNDPQWSTYINAWAALALTRITVMLGVLFFFDRVIAGHSIIAILDVEPNSSSEDKRTAALFMLGIAGLTLWAMMTGNF